MSSSQERQPLDLCLPQRRRGHYLAAIASSEFAHELQRQRPPKAVSISTAKCQKFPFSLRSRYSRSTPQAMATASNFLAPHPKAPQFRSHFPSLTSTVSLAPCPILLEPLRLRASCNPQNRRFQSNKHDLLVGHLSRRRFGQGISRAGVWQRSQTFQGSQHPTSAACPQLLRSGSCNQVGGCNWLFDAPSGQGQLRPRCRDRKGSGHEASF